LTESARIGICMKSRRNINNYWQIILAALVVAFALWRLFSQSGPGPGDLRFRGAGIADPGNSKDPFTQ
jgi:hypothetical protein